MPGFGQEPWRLVVAQILYSRLGGHYDCYGRGLMFPIRNTPDARLNEIIRRLEKENFHAFEGSRTDLVDTLADEIEAFVDTDCAWFRL